LGCTHDGTHDSVVSAAAAKVAIQGGSDLRFSGFGISVQQGLSLHDHAGSAVTTLGRLLVDKGLLKFAGLAIGGQT
jgi:hypothetical protein